MDVPLSHLHDLRVRTGGGRGHRESLLQLAVYVHPLYVFSVLLESLQMEAEIRKGVDFAAEFVGENCWLVMDGKSRGDFRSSGYWKRYYQSVLVDLEEVSHC